MVFPNRLRNAGEDLEGEPFIVPLAIPYVAGPSVLAVEMLLMSDSPLAGRMADRRSRPLGPPPRSSYSFGSQVAERLGQRGLVAIERLMGMILVAIAIQMFLTGADMYFGRA